MIATLWVAAGSHCRLEILPGFEFLSCCQHSDVEKNPTHHEKDCQDDGCAAVELGFYKLAKPQPAPLKPLRMFVAWLVPLPYSCQAGESVCLVPASSSPPDLPRIWQFSQRTALPPRAPSIVS
ncbi:MAG: hypothetical protein WCK27_23845 [Verrucomicrobiota bacterium]